MADNKHEHLTPMSTYLKVYGSLIVLTFITVFIAQFNFGWLNTPIAMLIATVKVFIVMNWFMHLNHDSNLNRATIGAAFIFAFIFFSFIAIDEHSRKNFTTIELQKSEPAATTTHTPPEEAPKTE